ncbi:ATP-binding protein [Candidatus Woesearchaeota archaeon]|nr:ATP-binding protein [Candidatus Woesearchaeota archaeon]
MELNVIDQIKRFQEFIEVNYYNSLLDKSRRGERFLLMDFSELSKFDPDLATELLDAPEETVKAIEKSVEQFDIDGLANFKIRFHNLPSTQNIMIRNIRSEHINKLLCIQGLVRQKSDVRPQVTSARFECPMCGNIMNVLQLEGTFKEPTRCGCGRKGKFVMLDKDLVDAQGIVLEEASENLEGGEQPKRFNVLLTNDLVSPISEKRMAPGSKVEVIGIVKEVPIISKTGGKSTRFDLMMESNYIKPMQDNFHDIKITDEEEKQILEIANDPNGYEKLVNSIAPSIYGYEKIKEALLLQLMGGVRKVRSDNVVSRGDFHILLVGDPGCIAGDSQVSLVYKGMEQIKSLGKEHLQPIKEIVTKIRKHSKDKFYDFATLFHHYRGQPVLRVVTETGKELVCTYNQPLLTKNGWQRADELLMGTEIRVMPKVPNKVKNLVPTSFTKVPKKSGHLKNISLPDKFTPELASLCGYIIGDGHVYKKGYTIACYVNNEEKDLVENISGLWKTTFNVTPSVHIKEADGSIKTIDDGTGLLRQIIAKQRLYLLETNSRQIAQSLSFLSNKRVPQQIFRSPNHVVAKFVSWLFEADGCAFGNGRGRTSIQLKSAAHDLLLDVQLLLLYFGIQSRVIEDNLCIRRSRDMELFAKHIGFNSEKKKKALQHVLEVIKNKSGIQKRKRPQRYEKVVKILPAGIRDVYDFEVPVSHMFIANGIVCHNSGKSALLKRITTFAPKGRYVSGKGVSGAGLTAAVVRDEFLRGWALEAGAMVLSSDGLVCVDELDKMSNEDRAAMHEALENQTVSISKANIQATLIARTTVLAAANPKFGRFDPYGIIADQIDLPPTLINRFDLIFPIKDLPEEIRDEKMAKHILTLHQNPEVNEPEISTEILRKYIAYARQKIVPTLTDGALEEIKNFYLTMRKSGGSEGGIKAIPISARQLEALVRLSEASARSRLDSRVTRKDSKKAIELIEYCLMQVGFDRETGKIDIDRIATGVGASQRSHIMILKDVITELESKLGKAIPIEDVVAEAKNRGLDENKVEEALERLKRSGDVYEPKRGFIGKL